MSFNTRAIGATVTINGKTVPIVDLIAQMQAEAARGAAHIPPSGPGGFNGATLPIKPSRPSSYYVLPFGKHRGTPINEVPEYYLRWLISKDQRAAAMLVRYPELRAEVEKQLGAPIAPPERSDRERFLEARIADLEHLLDIDRNTIRRLEDEVASTNRTKLMDDLNRANRESYQKHIVINQYRARLEEALKKNAPTNGQKSAPPAATQDIKSAIKRWWRNLSLRYHPDRNGSDVEMAVVTEAYSSLIRMLEEQEK